MFHRYSSCCRSIQNNFRRSISLVYGSDTCKHVGQKAKVAVVRSYVKRGRQLYCWICHSIKSAVLGWPMGGPLLKQFMQSSREGMFRRSLSRSLELAMIASISN